MQDGAAPEGTAWQFLQKLHLERPDDPANSASGYTPQGTENGDPQQIVEHPCSERHRSLQPRAGPPPTSTAAPSPAPRPSTDEWISNTWYVCYNHS